MSNYFTKLLNDYRLIIFSKNKLITDAKFTFKYDTRNEILRGVCNRRDDLEICITEGFNKSNILTFAVYVGEKKDLVFTSTHDQEQTGLKVVQAFIDDCCNFILARKCFNNIVVYEDKDDNGTNYTLYINGACVGSCLYGDALLLENVGTDWEKFKASGLDNRKGSENNG